MSAIVPVSYSASILAGLISGSLRLRLYSNNYTPIAASSFAAFTEVAGGGYAMIVIAPGDWVQTDNVALAGSKTFNFTGATSAPGVVYGYYITDTSNVLRYAERFPPTVVPFTPDATNYIRIRPRLGVNE